MPSNDDACSAATRIDAQVLAVRAHLSIHPEERQAGLDPRWHYSRFGRLFWRRGDDADADEAAKVSDAAAYLEANPDVAHAGCDAWWHYVHFGRHEGRRWGPTRSKSVGSPTAAVPLVRVPDVELG